MGAGGCGRPAALWVPPGAPRPLAPPLVLRAAPGPGAGGHRPCRPSPGRGHASIWRLPNVAGLAASRPRSPLTRNAPRPRSCVEEMGRGGVRGRSGSSVPQSPRRGRGVSAKVARCDLTRRGRARGRDRESCWAISGSARGGGGHGRHAGRGARGAAWHRDGAAWGHACGTPAAAPGTQRPEVGVSPSPPPVGQGAEGGGPGRLLPPAPAQRGGGTKLAPREAAKFSPFPCER